jgi:antitoxin (DNA-binding transcriptional repressor) of toxin-antitoxin stability system
MPATTPAQDLAPDERRFVSLHDLDVVDTSCGLLARSTRATQGDMARNITQRELRNDSGAIMRALDAGETFVVTRNGVPAAELRPIKRRRFVATATVLTSARALAPVQKTGRKGRRRVVDLMIASIAAANGLPLYTRNCCCTSALALLSSASSATSADLFLLIEQGAGAECTRTN